MVNNHKLFVFTLMLMLLMLAGCEKRGVVEEVSNFLSDRVYVEKMSDKLSEKYGEKLKSSGIDKVEIARHEFIAGYGKVRVYSDNSSEKMHVKHEHISSLVGATFEYNDNEWQVFVREKTIETLHYETVEQYLSQALDIALSKTEDEQHRKDSWVAKTSS